MLVLLIAVVGWGMVQGQQSPPANEPYRHCCQTESAASQKTISSPSRPLCCKMNLIHLMEQDHEQTDAPAIQRDDGNNSPVIADEKANECPETEQD
jgi:hypothetical protein